MTLARKVGPSGQVIAVEMLPETANILRDHVMVNRLDHVNIVQMALSDCPAELVEATVTPGKFGQATMARADRRETAAAKRASVSTTTIDGVASATSGQIAVIKLDLEGAERLALRGASARLARTDAVIFEQLNGDNRARDLLENAGFALRALDGNNLVAQK